MKPELFELFDVIDVISKTGPGFTENQELVFEINEPWNCMNSMT